MLANEDEQPPQIRISKFNQRDISIGAAGMFVFAFFAAMLTIDVPASEITPIVFLVIATIIFLITVNATTMIVNYFLNKKTDSSDENLLESRSTKNLLKNKKQATYLPESQSIPTDILVNNFNTNELERPPSVTESTTNQLKIRQSEL